MQKLGLDLGSSSIGWVLREDNKIEKKGVITFRTGMKKGKGGVYTSPAKDRREARSKRKLIQSRKYRKWELLKVLLNEYVPLDEMELEIWSQYKKGRTQKFPENPDFIKWLKCDFSYTGRITNYNNPYELRIKGINENIEDKLSKHELGRALYHLVQRRGYMDIGETDDETEKQIKRRGESGFQTALDENRSIAEALKKEFLDKGKRARNQYPYREEYQSELVQILKTQGYDITQNEIGEYNDSFVQKVWKAIIWQRPLRTQKGNIGKCTLEPAKQRCPISHPIFEIFRALQFINTIKYFDENGEKKCLEQNIRDQVFEFFLKKDKNFKFEDVKTYLNKQFGSNKKYNYPINKEGKYDTSIPPMLFCNGLITVIGEEVRKSVINIETYNLSDKNISKEKIKKVFEKFSLTNELDHVTKKNIILAIENDCINNAQKFIRGYSLYDLWHILFSFNPKTAKDKKFLEKFAIEKLNILNDTKKKVEYNPFAQLKNKIQLGYADLSLKAMCKIIPFLKEGYLYNEAVVLAKLPELLVEKWDRSKDIIKISFHESIAEYNNLKTVVVITNNLIDQYKGLEPYETFAFRNYQYILDKSDIKEIEKACVGFFGVKTWELKTNKDQVLDKVKDIYQAFFHDSKRAYREVPLLTSIFRTKLKENKIEMSGDLYHHSNIENKYVNKHIDPKTGKIKLHTYIDKKTGIAIKTLPEPRIDSIKNPMFNKSMSILRKLVNQLIIEGIIDEDTEIVVEIARELNDNNKRVAIERYQNLRRDNRTKYREFLNEYNIKEKRNVNLEESISTFELWIEQTFEETKDEKGKPIFNKNTIEILKEKDAVKRYELWIEQKGQCMYTGKMISITQLFSNEIDIAHTIPRSLLPDNTMANMTVAYAKYNRDIQTTKTPFYCENYSKDREFGTSILPRLAAWIEKKDKYKRLYEDGHKPKGNEDEVAKNNRVQDKHYYKMHYDYWRDKIERFTAEEIKDSWARRQLVDTQMVSKYAREFLKIYFKKVAVQKGTVTADFRKIFGFQEKDQIKTRNKHTHHAIDAAVLTLIPTNSSHRDRLLKEYYLSLESFQEMRNREPFKDFDSQKLISNIENGTLIVNHEDDKIMKQTYKNIRTRGRLQYRKDIEGGFVFNQDGEKILLQAKGDTLRSELYAQTYLGKIKDVERYDDGFPKREGNEWKYKTGKSEYIFVKRESIDKVKISDKLIAAIVDPVIRILVQEQKNNAEIKDYQGKIMRHVRIKTSTGNEVKERINYRSELEHKNKFYAEAGSLPYAILLQKSVNGKVEREMLPVASFELAKIYNIHRKFDIDTYLEKYDSEHKTDFSKKYQDKKLLKVGQKLLVLKNDAEYDLKNEIDFQRRRLYIITQFSEGSIWLKYHLEAQSKDEIKDNISILKDDLLRRYEIEFGIDEVVEDITIQDNRKRKLDYETRRFSFDNNRSFRLQLLTEKVGLDKAKEVKNELDKFKAISSTIEVEGKSSLLKMTNKNWNFLYEGHEFEISILGKMLIK